MLGLFCGLFLIVFLRLLLLLQQTGAIGNPRIVLFLVEIPDVSLFDAVITRVFSAKVEQIVNVIEFVVSLLYVFFEALKFKINLKPFLSANVAL